jgi:hypothetical protein
VNIEWNRLEKTYRGGTKVRVRRGKSEILRVPVRGLRHRLGLLRGSAPSDGSLVVATGDPSTAEANPRSLPGDACVGAPPKRRVPLLAEAA